VGSFEQWERFHRDTTPIEDAATSPNRDCRRVDMQRTVAAQTITEFDDSFIAPLYGFDDCWDYHQQTSCIHYLDRIAVPTLMINARDDPFFDDSVWPAISTTTSTQPEVSMCDGKAPIQMVRSARGGHLGYSFIKSIRLIRDLSRMAKRTYRGLIRFLPYLETFVQ
jgi:predicted alpha/beta-fold hydrolase